MSKLESSVFACIDALLKDLNIKESSEALANFEKGANFTGDIKRLCLKGTKNGKKIELRLVVKVSKGTLSTRRIQSWERAHQCEICMYETVFPLFRQMQSECDNRFESYPTYFGSSTEYLNEVLVLEDMVRYRVMERQEVLSYEKALILVKEVGKFHAMSLVLRKRDPKLLRQISGQIRDEKRSEDNIGILVSSWFHVWLPRVLALFDAEKDQEAYRKLQDFSKTVEKMFDLHYNFDCEDKYGVISHCDLWSTNLLFSDNEVCIVDWQTARVCSPTLDLLQILFGCCDKKLRDEHYNDLIKEYYKSCSEHLQRLHEDPNELFPYHVFKKHLQRYGCYGMLMAMKTIFLISVLTLPDIAKVNEVSDIIESHKVAKTNPDIFDVRVRDVLLDFLSYGYDL